VKTSNPITSGGLVTIREAARFLGISTSTFYANILGKGLVPVVRVGRRTQIPRAALVALAEPLIEDRP